MESDLSSSDAALRMLLVEDVELLESGILASSSVVKVLLMRLRARGAARALLCAQSFSLSTQVSPSFYGGHLFAVSDVKRANSPTCQSMHRIRRILHRVVRACVRMLGVGRSGLSWNTGRFSSEVVTVSHFI